MGEDPRAILEALPDCFSQNEKPGTIEKVFRLASFVSLIVSGLRQKDQLSMWVSDHDETLDSHDRRERFARLATYLTFGLTGWKEAADHLFCTTEAPAAPYWAEDLTAIPDLIAGAYCQLSHYLPVFLGRETWQVQISPRNVNDQRALIVSNWLSAIRGPLKHVLLRLEHDPSGIVRASAQSFMGFAPTPAQNS